MNRPKYQTRHIMLIGSMQKETAKILIDNAPMDAVHPIEFVIREAIKPRKIDQQKLMWSGALKDISEQAWVQGKQFSAEVWHEHFKREYLPETFTEGETLEGYEKWSYLPSGERVLIGSTTKLTTKGFAKYLDQVHAFGGGLGVRFHTVDRMAA